MALGELIVVCGPMFSGKTEHLISQARLAPVLQRTIAVLRPERDSRSPVVVSHSGLQLPQSPFIKILAVPVPHEGEKWKPVRLPPGTAKVALEEGQFFPDEIFRDVQKWRGAGMDVLITGLDMDSKGDPFELMSRFMGVATSVSKRQAVCMRCREPAHFSYRKAEDGSRVLIGGADLYEARCGSCWIPR